MRGKSNYWIYTVNKKKIEYRFGHRNTQHLKIFTQQTNDKKIEDEDKVSPLADRSKVKVELKASSLKVWCQILEIDYTGKETQCNKNNPTMFTVIAANSVRNSI